jgi:hypothetical protein
MQAVWPAVRARIVSRLRGLGTPVAEAEDIAQEVAIRALREPRRFASEEHLVRWCSRVAANLRVDEIRRGTTRHPGELPDVEGGFDTARTVERRLALDILSAEIAQLSEDDRRLLFEVESSASRREAVRLAVRRHRLRTRLAALVEGLLAGIVVVRRVRPGGIARAAVVVVPIAAVLGLPLLHDAPPSDPGPSVPRSITTQLPVGGDPARTAAQVSSGTSAGNGTSRGAAPAPAERLTIIRLQPAGHQVGAYSHQPEAPQTLCLDGWVDVCADRPGPHVPEPDLPNLLPPG